MTATLTPQQISDLAEIGNIGAGNAASGLSELIHRKCVISIPEVAHLTVQGIRELCDAKNALVVTISLRILGDIPADVLVITKRASARRVVQYATDAPVRITQTDWDFNSMTALKQIGERVTEAFAHAFNEFLQSTPTLTMPEIFIDSWHGGLQALFERLCEGEDEPLVISSDFFDDERTFDGQFLCIMNAAATNEVLGRLDAMRDA